MKILLTGANGQLGKACREQFAESDLLLTDVDTLNITDAEQCQKTITEFNPEIIIHTAAYTDVKKAEQDPSSCYDINLHGTYNLIHTAKDYDVTFVYISTDYVFDGQKDNPYHETDPVNPLSVYGRSKLAGELVVRDLIKKHYVIRTAWLYGSGRNFVHTILNLAEKQSKLPVVCDQRGTPTYTKDLAQFIATILNQGSPGIYHATNDDDASWAEFAEEILRIANKAAVVEPITTAKAQKKFGDTTERPRYSVLAKNKLKQLTPIRAWQEALREYLEITPNIAPIR